MESHPEEGDLMNMRLLIAFVLLSFVMAGSASAVKRVPKTGDQTADQRQLEPQGKQVPAKGTPPSVQHQDGNRQEAKSSQPEPSKGNGDKDRFIDRDGDGINDNLKKPPETIRRKHDDRGERHHSPGSDSQKPESKKPDTQKPEKDRQSR
jgi:hypothetical protein